VGFHGYAQTAAIFLEPLERTAPPGWLIASVQALHPFYAARANAVVANWMTREDRELAIADNIAYVDAVLDDLELGFGAPRAIVFAGFSQGVAMAYRAGVRGRRRASAIVVAGGDLPPDLAEPGPVDWPRVLAATGAADPSYTPARLLQDAEFLRTRSTDVQTLVFDGGHTWADEVVAAARSLLEGVAATLDQTQT
jgi:predicted esterase